MKFTLKEFFLHEAEEFNTECPKCRHTFNVPGHPSEPGYQPYIDCPNCGAHFDEQEVEMWAQTIWTKPGGIHEHQLQVKQTTAGRSAISSPSEPVQVKRFFTNDDGQTFVVEAGRQFKLLRTNTLSGYVLASPALVDGVWYWRTDAELIAIGR